MRVLECSAGGGRAGACACAWAAECCWQLSTHVVHAFVRATLAMLLGTMCGGCSLACHARDAPHRRDFSLVDGQTLG